MQVGTRCAVTLGPPVDFVVERAEQGPWFVDAAVRGGAKRALDIALLDADRRALQPQPTTTVHSVWGSVHSTHLLAPFTGDEPAFVALSMGKRSKVVPLEDSRQSGRRDKPRGKPGREEEPMRRAPGKKHCCLAENPLETPTGEQRTTIRRLLNSDGTIAGYAVQPRPFVRRANYTDEGEDCDCSCCEYREQVKGIFRMRGVQNGVYLNWAPILDYTPPDADGVMHGVYPTADTWTNVSMPVPKEPGNPIRVGNPLDMRPRDESPYEWVNQDLKDCRYWLDYYPRLMSVPPTMWLEVNATFRGGIVDRCNGDNLLAGWNEWTWRYNGMVGPD